MGFRNVSFCHTILPSLLLPICLSSLHFSHFDLFSPVHSLFNKRLFVIAILTTKGNTLALDRQGPLGMCKTVTAWCSSITEQVCIDDKKRHVRSDRRTLKSLTPTPALLISNVSGVARLPDCVTGMNAQGRLVIYTPMITNTSHSHFLQCVSHPRVNDWRVWSGEIHEDRDNGWYRLPVHTWAQPYLNDDSPRQKVTGLETLLMGRHAQSKRVGSCVCVWMCVSVYVSVVGGRGRLLEAALWSTSSVTHHSSQAEEESSLCSLSHTVSIIHLCYSLLLCYLVMHSFITLLPVEKMVELYWKRSSFNFLL